MMRDLLSRGSTNWLHIGLIPAHLPVGPQSSEGAIEGRRSAGARILAGGQVPELDGWFVQPTVVDGLGPEHRLTPEETFGPQVTILSAATVQEAVAIANGVKYGLVTSVHGRDLDRLLATAAPLDPACSRSTRRPATSTSTPRSVARRSQALARARRARTRSRSTRHCAP